MAHTASDPSERFDNDFRAELAHTALARPGRGVFACAADSVEGLRQRVIGCILVVSIASIGGFEQCTDPTLSVSSTDSVIEGRNTGAVLGHGGRRHGAAREDLELCRFDCDCNSSRQWTFLWVADTERIQFCGGRMGLRLETALVKEPRQRLRETEEPSYFRSFLKRIRMQKPNVRDFGTRHARKRHAAPQH